FLAAPLSVSTARSRVRLAGSAYPRSRRAVLLMACSPPTTVKGAHRPLLLPVVRVRGGPASTGTGTPQRILRGASLNSLFLASKRCRGNCAFRSSACHAQAGCAGQWEERRRYGACKESSSMGIHSL